MRPLSPTTLVSAQWVWRIPIIRAPFRRNWSIMSY